VPTRKATPPDTEPPTRPVSTKLDSRTIAGDGRGETCKGLPVIVLAVLLGATSTIAQTPRSQGKPAERVVIPYEKFIASGAFLTPDGWQTAAKLFDAATPMRVSGLASRFRYELSSSMARLLAAAY
jgi:hypothetical protein